MNRCEETILLGLITYLLDHPHKLEQKLNFLFPHLRVVDITGDNEVTFSTADPTGLLTDDQVQLLKTFNCKFVEGFPFITELPIINEDKIVEFCDLHIDDALNEVLLDMFPNAKKLQDFVLSGNK